MKEFDGAVKKAHGIVDEVEDQGPPKIRSMIEYIVVGEGYSEEKWPPRLLYRPVVGDKVESQNGRKLLINEVTHKQNTWNDPVIVLTLGRDLGGQHGTSGGGEQSIEMEP